MLSRPLKPVQSSLEVAGAEGTQGVERRESVHQACTFFLCKHLQSSRYVWKLMPGRYQCR